MFGNVLVYAVRDAGGVLHEPKYNPRPPQGTAARRRGGSACNYFALTYVCISAVTSGDETR